MAASTLEPVLGRNGLLNPGTTRFADSSLSSSPLVKTAYHLTLLLVVLLVGRVPELTVLVAGTSFYQITVLNAILLAFLVITGMLVKVGSTRGGMFWMAFHLWVVFTIPFSGYRKGSVDALLGILPIIPSLFFIGGFFPRTIDTLRRGIWAFAWAGVIGLAFIQKEGVDAIEDRFSAGSGTFGNSNLVAIYLLLMVPIWLYVARNPRYNWAVRMLFGAFIIDSILVVVRTGSRSGFITMIILALILFLTASLADKAKLVVVLGLGGFLAIGTMSEAQKSRIGTIFNGEAKDEVTAEAAESAAQRTALFWESIDVTIRHPIVGSGFGVYSETAAGEKAKKGQRGLWLVTHNMYTQVSAETGLVGFAIYMTGMIFGIKAVWAAWRLGSKNREYRELGLLAGALLSSWVVFAFNGFFTSMALDFSAYVMNGYSIAFAILTESLLRNRAQQAYSGANDSAPRSTRFFPAFPAAAPAPASAVSVTGRPVTVPAAAPAIKNADAPWRRNPRKHPPQPGTPSR